MDRDKPRSLTPEEMAQLSPEERDEEIAGLRAGKLRRLKIIRQRELAGKPLITPKEYAEHLAGEKLKRPKRHSIMTEIFYVDETNKISAFPPREINSRRELFAIEDINDPQELVDYAAGCYPVDFHPELSRIGA